MKFLQNLFLITIIFITTVNADTAKSPNPKNNKKNIKNIKFDNIKPNKYINLGHSYGLQSYPGKTTYPENTQALPTTWTSHMGNNW